MWQCPECELGIDGPIGGLEGNVMRSAHVREQEHVQGATSVESHEVKGVHWASGLGSCMAAVLD